MPDFDVKLKRNGVYFQAYWTLPGTRRRKVKSLGSSKRLSERQARALCRQLALDLTANWRPVEPNPVPRLSEWLEIFDATRKPVRASTRKMYRYTANYLTRFFERDPKLNQITHADADDWRTALASGELSLDNLDRCDPPAEGTVCKHTRNAKTIFRAAVRKGHVTANPFAELKGNPGGAEPDWFEMTADDMCKILDACPSDGWRALFALARWTGMRREEARRLRWGDVLWDRNRIIVNAREKNATTKWRKRVCPIEPRDYPTGLFKLLRGWYENAAEGTPGPCHGVSEHNMSDRTQRILNAAGVVYAKPLHTLRKCWETELAMRFPLHVVVAWLGNTFEVARKHYLRVPEELYGEARQTPPRVVVFEGGRFVAVDFVPKLDTNATTSGQSGSNPPITPGVRKLP